MAKIVHSALTCELTSNTGTEADRLTDGVGDPSQMIEVVITDRMFYDPSIIATDVNSPNEWILKKQYDIPHIVFQIRVLGIIFDFFL